MDGIYRGWGALDGIYGGWGACRFGSLATVARAPWNDVVESVRTKGRSAEGVADVTIAEFNARLAEELPHSYVQVGPKPWPNGFRVPWSFDSRLGHRLGWLAV